MDKMNRKETLIAAIKQIKTAVGGLIGFGFISNLLLLSIPLYMIQIFDRVLSSGRVETLLVLTLIVVLILLVMGAMETVRTRLVFKMANWLENTLSPLLIEVSMSGALKGLPASAQSLRDLKAVRSFITGALKSFTDILWVPLFIGVIFLLHSWLGWVALAFTLVLLGIAWLNEKTSRDPTLEASGQQVKNQHLADLAVRNSDVIHAMGMFGHFLNGWEMRIKKILSLQQLASNKSSVFFGLSRFLRMVAQVFALGLGAYLVLNIQLTPGGMIAGSILMARALGPVEQTISSWKSFLNARSAYDRLHSLIDVVGEVSEFLHRRDAGLDDRTGPKRRTRGESRRRAEHPPPRCNGHPQPRDRLRQDDGPAIRQERRGRVSRAASRTRLLGAGRVPRVQPDSP